MAKSINYTIDKALYNQKAVNKTNFQIKSKSNSEKKKKYFSCQIDFYEIEIKANDKKQRTDQRELIIQLYLKFF